MRRPSGWLVGWPAAVLRSCPITPATVVPMSGTSPASAPRRPRPAALWRLLGAPLTRHPLTHIVVAAVAMQAAATLLFALGPLELALAGLALLALWLTLYLTRYARHVVREGAQGDVSLAGYRWRVQLEPATARHRAWSFLGLLPLTLLLGVGPLLPWIALPVAALLVGAVTAVALPAWLAGPPAHTSLRSWWPALSSQLARHRRLALRTALLLMALAMVQALVLHALEATTPALPAVLSPDRKSVV